MEFVFDNKYNVLDAKLHTTLDDAVVYTLETNCGFRGRRFTLLRDTNPLPGRRQSTAGSATTGATVDAINRREKTMEVSGVRKKIASDSTSPSNPFNGDGSTTLDPMENIDGPEQGLIGRLQVPFRPHLFTKSKPPKLRIKRAGLAEDDVFLIVIFIYSEAKRLRDTQTP
ncbi:hypothetical protein Moror_4876 [Moniliophthora roreri MCA 2997]|uniref:Uncharacterized protein n=2 Tax=Moniliophthora roreri TaxID=221103 RepID=V2WSG5_MONRO|nr:hypothetical protein Moror_4876 [Moniliophthora roreri MCA 2997]